MNFGEELNKYIEILNCSTNDICKASGISYSLINRYINNKRTPKEDSENFDKVVNAIYQISIKNKVDLSKESIYQTLKEAITANTSSIDFDLFIDNFNNLQEELSITTAEMSRAIGYDSSFVSRIKNKERKPADIESFIDKLRDYIVYVVSKNEQKKANLIHILGYSEKDLQDTENFKEILTKWLCSKRIENKQDNVLDFLIKLDNFDLNDYIGTDFSKIKVPTTPIILKNSKMYFGDEPIFFYSDLPMSAAGADEEFKKRWVYAMTLLLKKGLHLNIVHNLNRPIDEMLLGLENIITKRHNN